MAVGFYSSPRRLLLYYILQQSPRIEQDPFRPLVGSAGLFILRHLARNIYRFLFLALKQNFSGPSLRGSSGSQRFLLKVDVNDFGFEVLQLTLARPSSTTEYSKLETISASIASLREVLQLVSAQWCYCQ